MGTYYYDGQVTFELPWDFEYSKEYDDEGKEMYHIRTGSYYNDDGEKCYKFSCGIGTAEASDGTPVTSLRDMLKDMLQSEDKTRGLIFDGELEVALVTRGMPMNLFGITLQYYTLLAFVLAGNEKVINLAVVQMYEEDDEDKNLAVFENMATIIRGLSVNGKKNDLKGMDAKALHTALKPCFNEEDNIDIGARLWEMLEGPEEEMSYADQPLPEGVCASEDGYAVINEDWAVRLPDGWVFSTEEEHTCGRPFAAISREEYDESGRSPFTYGDNCFTVFRVAESESNEYGMHSLLAGLMNSDEETVIDRPGLKVSYNCHHEGNTTYCQYVTVATYRASYMIQLFYTDTDLGEFSRVMKIEEILKTICHSYEVPYSERYQRREHTKLAVTTKKTTKKNSISFKRACPDESLYPHYHSLLNSPMKSLGFLGVNVVVNSTGTEYEFQSFHSMLNSFSSDPDANLSDTQRDRLMCILNSDTAPYDLHEKAKAMQRLFHVEPSVFDPKHDRECELEHGLMHRAYMMSALRSFAWTLSAYCKESGETPATVDYSHIRDLIAYIAGHNWLNYDGESHCDGLCGGSDLHVYFVPDSTSVEDRQQLFGDGMSEEEEARIREKFQNFNIIRSQVRSLDALRRDLAYIYPTIEKIYNTLKTSRNNREQLLGDEADILYAWCALALAAKEPFFSEDGPMNYWFDQEETEEEAEANQLQQEKAAYDAWMANYGEYLARDPQISFAGKLFVFSGLATHADPKDHPTIQKVLGRGGEFRTKVSGLTDYLVIDPVSGGGSKLNTAIEQQKKGKSVQIILLKDLEATLQGGVRNASVAGNAGNAKPQQSRPEDWSIDEKGVLSDYGGGEKDVIIPQGVVAIGEYAFLSKEITSVVIPEGVKELEDDAFWGCKQLVSVQLPTTLKKIGSNAFYGCKSLQPIVIPDGVMEIGSDAFTFCEDLKDIYLPDSVWNIEDDAFCTFCDDMVLHVPEYSDAETYAQDHDLKYDHKKPPKPASAEKEKPAKTAKQTTIAKPKKNIFSTSDFHIENNEIIKYYGGEAEVVIPEGVTVIGEHALEGKIPAELLITENVELESNRKHHLLILANFKKNSIYKKVFDFPVAYGITFDAEQTIFNWKTCNRVDDVEAGIDGLGSAVNFTSVFTSGGKIIGGLYDALIECYGPRGDALFDEFYEEIASAIKNDSAISLILASVIPQNGKMCGSWIVMDYSGLTLKEGKEEWEASESEALEKARTWMEEQATLCQTTAAEAERRREEAAQQRMLQRIRQEAEEERKRQKDEEERRRRAAEEAEAERQRQAEIAAKCARYDEISEAIKLQMQIISQNKGWFGAQAKVRKAAQVQLATLQAQLAKEFPNGKP